MATKDSLPVYHPITASSSSSTTSAPSGSISSYTASAKTFVIKFTESGKAVLSRQRPWSELLDRNSFAKPESLSEATGRLQKNVTYFKVNYAVFSALVVAISLFWHPWSLVVLLTLLAAWNFLYISRTDPVVLFNRSYNEREVLAILGVLTFVVIFFTSTGSTIFMGLCMAAALVILHAAFRTPDDLFLEEPVNVSNNYVGYQSHQQHPI